MSRRKQARSAVRVWYEARVQFGRAKYPRQSAPRKPRTIPAERSRDPDPLAQAKKQRPENWTSRRVRQVIGEDGQPALDSRGNPVCETVDLDDVLSADGTETRPSPRSRAPSGGGMTVEVGSRQLGPRQPTSPREDPINFIDQTIRRLGIVEPEIPEVLEMWAAGFTRRQIADMREYTSKSTADLHFECGMAMIEFALLVRPDYRKAAHFIPTMTLADIGC